MYQRGLVDRLLGLCIAFFVRAALVYYGIQILISVWPYIVMAAAFGCVVAFTFGVIRWRRERW